MRGVWERLKPHLPREIPIVYVAKGLETSSLLRPTQVIADVLGGKRSFDAGPTCDWPLVAPHVAYATNTYAEWAKERGGGDTRYQAAETVEARHSWPRTGALRGLPKGRAPASRLDDRL